MAKKTAKRQVSTGGNREQALDMALAAIDKQFGKGSVMRLGENTHRQVEVLWL